MIEKVNPKCPDKITDRIVGTIVEIAREYIKKQGRFEKFAEWGLF